MSLVFFFNIEAYQYDTMFSASPIPLQTSQCSIVKLECIKAFAINKRDTFVAPSTSSISALNNYQLNNFKLTTLELMSTTDICSHILKKKDM